MVEGIHWPVGGSYSDGQKVSCFHGNRRFITYP